MKLTLNTITLDTKVESFYQFFTNPTVTVSGDVNVSNIEQLIMTDFWPEAVAPSMIVNGDREIKERAKSIIKYYVGDLSSKSFLDFGCGDGSCVQVAKSTAKSAIGYDIIRCQTWDDSCTDDQKRVRSFAPYDTILAYDVFDHLLESQTDEAFDFLKSLCTDQTVIKMRCHPFTAIHGGHMYKKLNKAYAHLFLDEKTRCVYAEGFTRIIHRPILTYRETIQKHGFTIKKEEMIKSAMSPAVSNIIKSPSVIQYITQMFGTDESWIDYVLPIDFIDYVIGIK